jgi:biopolymer transport protein ExbD
MAGRKVENLIVRPGKRPGKRLAKSKVFGGKFMKGKKGTNLDLQLTSMIDVFVLLVIFLIQQFSADGDLLFLTDKIRMPEAANFEQLERAPVIQVSADQISLEGAPVADVSDVLHNEYLNIPALEEQLRDQKKRFEQLREMGASGDFKAEIHIQADKAVQFNVLKRVMFSATQAGYGNINFAVLAGGGTVGKAPKPVAAAAPAEEG